MLYLALRSTPLVLALLSLHPAPVLSLSKLADKSIEYVKACDSGPDDVTNQCISRIPEDIGMNTNNHACAYHEAEVKCLGLCGNTITWKVAYTNALKRYRLVCAGYIEERLMEKDDEGEGGDNFEGDSESGGKPKKQPPAEKDAGDPDGGDGGEPPKPKKKQSAEKSTLQASVATPAQSKASAAQKSMSKQTATAKRSKAASTSAAAEQTKPSPVSKRAKAKKPSSSDAESKDRMDNGGIDGLEKEGKMTNGVAQALLPTMDPDLAGSPHTVQPLATTWSLLALLSALAVI
ncbi:hypothetical protein GQ54DRAFT_305708 [Martensiomyces pterosporus]|nr:hypothetical protein GQ54DRAFT_305708 [Martensiomyces pterosporus]